MTANAGSRFSVLTEINDKKRTIVISTQPKAKPKKEKKEKPDEPVVIPGVPAQAVKAQAPKKAEPTDAPRTLKEAAEQMQRKKEAERKAAEKTAAEKEKAEKEKVEKEKAEKEKVEKEKPAEKVADKPAEKHVEEPAAHGETKEAAEKVPNEKPVEKKEEPEIPTVTMEEYNKQREANRFVMAQKEARRVDPKNYKGLTTFDRGDGDVLVKLDPAQLAANSKKPAAPAAAASKAKGKAPAAPIKEAPKAEPKEKRPQPAALKDFVGEQPRRGGNNRGYANGNQSNSAHSKPVNVDDNSAFPTLA